VARNPEPQGFPAPERAAWRDLWVGAADGLKLHARDYGSRLWPRLPVICLPGLTRNSKDFHDLALRLATHPERPRRVLALDYRGRGLSDHDPDWRHYDLMVEARDCLDVATAAGIHEAVVIGTSRGGLLAMIFAALRPALLRGVVLNDVGPEVDPSGLTRIRAAIGQIPATLASWDEAVALVRASLAPSFPKFSDADWRQIASGAFREENGKLRPDFDLNLIKPLEALDLEAGTPTLWPQFEGLRGLPTLAIRGALSDVLSAETLERMAARHPRLETIVVPNTGHAPRLSEPEAVAAIEALIEAAERDSAPTGMPEPSDAAPAPST
jgi:pimeloyl-ACP methyl ester carboxylesterase